ncbi:TOBE domain protein [mine drainage metagenome]|uniref:TOBE domain protein n=1 Tax=mine drainage metagenome TaxID=410659 RepID=A0A1J5P4S8_9ZZZZ
MLRGRLEGFEGAFAVVAVGAARVKVSGVPLAGVARSVPVDLFVRPEHLAISEVTEACATDGTAVAHVYQGGYVDTYIECGRDRLLVRSAGHEAMTRWPTGSRVGLSITSGEGVAFV